MAGVIAAGSVATATAGKQILNAGGNAVDAAVAAAFVSFISEIGVVHLGGSGIAHLYDPRGDDSLVYDFFSNAPGLEPGPRTTPLDFSEVIIDFGATTQSFHMGRGAVAVPGNIAGLCRMATDYGRLPLAQLLAPAIKIARDGTKIEAFQADTCDLLNAIYTHTPGMREIFQKNGQIIQPGEHLFIPDLADTLTALATEGEPVVRDGRLAQAFVADQMNHGGLITPTDLQRYDVRKVESIRQPYREYEILLPPPSSTGGVLTALSLSVLSHFDVKGCGHGTTAHLQLFYEVMVAINRARPYWESLNSRLDTASAIDRFLASDFVNQVVAGVRSGLQSQQASPFVPEPGAPNNTSHLSVIDGEGLAVGLTTTAGESAGYIVPGTGFIPNNMMGEADLHPNGFHQTEAGTRLQTMMTPAIALKDGMTRLVVGSGGSIRIRSALLHVFMNVLDFGMPLAEAVNVPRFHVESGALQCEAGYAPDAVDKLEPLGIRVNRWPTRSIYFGGAHSVSRTPSGRLVAAGDDRRGGAVARA